ncbi:hypothetical protein ACFQS7_26530 [Dankookia sp. GCM10030260]|uniref:hypothetical protein n=1 Tax=Dankookia sp. GCM10030260 TaxID=3273390 RepID=UPI00361EAF2C
MILGNAEISARQHDAVLQRTRADFGWMRVLVELYCAALPWSQKTKRRGDHDSRAA